MALSDLKRPLTVPAPPGTVLDAAEIREEIRHGPCSQGVYRFGDTCKGHRNL